MSLRSAAAWAALLATSLLGCRDGSPGRILRLGSLVTLAEASVQALPAPTTIGTERARIPVELDAAGAARLELEARGDAGLLTVAWRPVRERRFMPFRELHLPLATDGRTHLYRISLSRDHYWNGTIAELALAVDRGHLEIERLAALPPATPYRTMSLKGETVPALAGEADRTLELPPDLPRRMTLDLRLGVVPEYDRPGVTTRFRIRSTGADGDTVWLDRTLAGSTAHGSPWRHLSIPVEVPRSARLHLAVEASDSGHPLPPDVALWGDPMLLAPGRAAGPNLVVVLVDTLRADALGAYGNRQGLTPSLDAFAEHAIRFAGLHADAPWTLPSVATLVTGLAPETHGAGRQVGDFAPTALPPGLTTLAEILATHGFVTTGVYNNIFVDPEFGLDQGFDRYTWIERPDAELVDRALAELGELRDRRFFLYLHLFGPHNPYEPPADLCRDVARRLDPSYAGPLGCAADRRPQGPMPPPSDWDWIHALYLAEVAAADRQVGRFLEGIGRLGLADDTVVLVVGDHGEEFWGRLAQEKAAGYESNADHGHSLYEDLLAVPGLLRIPGRPAAVVTGTSRLMELFPTLLTALGVEPPADAARDLTPYLDGGPVPEELAVADFLLYGPARWSARKGRWKLIVPEASALPVELYDLEKDPGETRDLAAAEPRVVQELRRLGEREIAHRETLRRRLLSVDELTSTTYVEWTHITKLRVLGYLR